MKLTLAKLILIVIGWLVLVLMVFPVFTRRHGSGPPYAVCISHVKNLATAFEMYLTDYDGSPPVANKWTDELAEYVRNRDVFRCDKDKSGHKSSYGMNAHLSGMRVEKPENRPDLIAIYETAHPGPNPVGGPSDVVSPPRHTGGNNYGFADGHAAWSASIPSFDVEEPPGQPRPSE